MENLPIVLSIVISFIDGHGISLDTAKMITWIGLIAVCFFIVSAITQFIDAKKRPYHEWWVRVYQNKLRELKSKNDITLRKIRKYSAHMLRHEMILMTIHIKEKSVNNSGKMFNKYFFEIINESISCITHVVLANKALNIFSETERIDKYLRQITSAVRNFSPKVMQNHTHSFRANYESLKDNFNQLLECLEKSNLESTKNEVHELLQVFEAAIFDFKQKK